MNCPSEEKQRLTDELLTQTPDHYSMDHVEKHFEGIMKGQRDVSQ